MLVLLLDVLSATTSRVAGGIAWRGRDQRLQRLADIRVADILAPRHPDLDDARGRCVVRPARRKAVC
jgi:hypothetical protein